MLDGQIYMINFAVVTTYRSKAVEQYGLTEGRKICMQRKYVTDLLLIVAIILHITAGVGYFLLPNTLTYFSKGSSHM